MSGKMQGWLGRITEPHLLFPLLTALVLGALWSITLLLIDEQRAAVRRAAAATALELSETYEAQVLRALREIDFTLKLVQLVNQGAAGSPTLADLKSRALLPPELLFSVSVVDASGELVAREPPAAAASLAGQPFFEALRDADVGLAVALPQRRDGSGDWILQFARRLQAADGSFGGAAVVEVDAAYFVSGYEQSRLGASGALGLLATDGVVRVLRIGDAISSGSTLDYDALLRQAGSFSDEVALLPSPWDGVMRYTRVRELFDFPLAVVVGVSEQEQLAVAAEQTRTSLAWAAAGTVLVLLLMAVLGRSSVQLARARRGRAIEQLEHAERVEYLAYHDALTGLPNRSLFSKLLEQAIREAQRFDRMAAVLFLDLDRFKHINDTLGHHAGDELLKTVAARLRACLRGSDTVARLGGDEFVVLLPSLDSDHGVQRVAQTILSAVSAPFLLLGQEFRVTASVGIALFPRDGADEQTLKKNADIAMYQAKAEGKNNFQFYSRQLDRESLERLTLESSLRHALERDEFELHYQAKRDIRGELICGTEALLRWRHPDLGTVAPMQFLPVADETGLIVAIGKWVLRTACRQSVAWRAAGLPQLVIAVNLTMRQFSDEHLLHDLETILAETGMDPGLLELEFAEALLMQNVERTLAKLQAIKRLGVRIAIDDFGLGYASLASLHRYPLDTIKIDRSFVRDLTDGSGNAGTAGAIIAMGRSLSLTVVAQGVETRAQADFLQRHACDELQGFYFNRPVPADAFAALLRAQAALT